MTIFNDTELATSETGLGGQKAAFIIWILRKEFSSSF